jgi:hypothetical protein
MEHNGSLATSCCEEQLLRLVVVPKAVDVPAAGSCTDAAS